MLVSWEYFLLKSLPKIRPKQIRNDPVRISLSVKWQQCCRLYTIEPTEQKSLVIGDWVQKPVWRTWCWRALSAQPVGRLLRVGPVVLEHNFVCVAMRCHIRIRENCAQVRNSLEDEFVSWNEQVDLVMLFQDSKVMVCDLSTAIMSLDIFFIVVNLFWPVHTRSSRHWKSVQIKKLNFIFSLGLCPEI